MNRIQFQISSPFAARSACGFGSRQFIITICASSGFLSIQPAWSTDPFFPHQELFFQVYPQVLFRDQQRLLFVPLGGPREQGPVYVPQAAPREQELVYVPLGGLEQRGDAGILSATLHPGHDGVVQKISGHNADLVGARANRDAFAENSPSNEDFVDTTQTTSEHTSYRVSRYKREDKRNRGPIHSYCRKSDIGCHSKTNHRCNRPTAY